MNNCCERALKFSFEALFICAKPKKFTDKLTDVKQCVKIYVMFYAAYEEIF